MSRELDLQVAKLMGFENIHYNKGYLDWAGDDTNLALFRRVPNYSTNISSAWTIIEKLRGVIDISSMPTTWYVRIAQQSGPFSDRIVDAEDSSIEKAICLAALKTLT